MKGTVFIICLILVLAIVGCATWVKSTLVGPDEYWEGHSEGCNSGYAAAGRPHLHLTKDGERYAMDKMYKQGWDDGFQSCKEKYEAKLKK